MPSYGCLSKKNVLVFNLKVFSLLRASCWFSALVTFHIFMCSSEFSNWRLKSSLNQFYISFSRRYIIKSRWKKEKIKNTEKHCATNPMKQNGKKINIRHSTVLKLPPMPAAAVRIKVENLQPAWQDRSEEKRKITAARLREIKQIDGKDLKFNLYCFSCYRWWFHCCCTRSLAISSSLHSGVYQSIYWLRHSPLSLILNCDT